MSRFKYGYRLDLEDLRELQRTSTRLPRMVFEPPDEVDPTWIRIENQGSQGSCAGHANTSCGELAYRIATGGDIAQFSPKFSYIVAQQIDGITGDQGSTINGGRLASMKYGYCPADICPYREQYDDQISDEAFEAAKDFKIRSHTLCRNYDDVFQFLASGQGGVFIGIAWPDDWMECRNGMLEYFRPGNGGHSVFIGGYSRRKDRRGRNYGRMGNSWSERWGDRGWAEISPDCINQFAAHRDTVMIGLSDLSTPTVRTIPDFAGAL